MIKRRLVSLDAFTKIDPFNMFEEEKHVKNFKDLADGDVLILWGGEDISPSLYGEKANNRVFASQNPSARDEREIAWIKEAIRRNIPIIGICRGAQLLCVVTGGKLMQHIDGHGIGHTVTLHDEEGKIVSCNSSHHQMMIPTDKQVILATSVGTTCIGENNVTGRVDRVNEVVWFPGIDALGIQPHPEWSGCPKEFVEYCKRKIVEYLCNEPT